MIKAAVNGVLTQDKSTAEFTDTTCPRVEIERTSDFANCTKRGPFCKPLFSEKVSSLKIVIIIIIIIKSSVWKEGIAEYKMGSHHYTSIVNFLFFCPFKQNLSYFLLKVLF